VRVERVLREGRGSMEITRRIEKMEKEIAEIKGELEEIKQSLARVEENIKWIEKMIKWAFGIAGFIGGLIITIL